MFEDDDKEAINEYKNRKIIWNLFRNDKKNEDFLIILKNYKFYKTNDFINLFPDELNESEIDTILSLISKIIEDEKDYNAEDFENDIFYVKMFSKNTIITHLIKDYKKYKIDISKIINIIIVFINKIKHNNKDLEEIIAFIDKEYLQKDIFIFENENDMVPIFFLKKTKNNETFQSSFLKKLSEYIIDEKTIFSEEKNNMESI